MHFQFTDSIPVFLNFKRYPPCLYLLFWPMKTVKLFEYRGDPKRLVGCQCDVTGHTCFVCNSVLMDMSQGSCCHCHKKDPMFKCGDCAAVAYCDKSCQTAAWKEKTHTKETCKEARQIMRKTVQGTSVPKTMVRLFLAMNDTEFRVLSAELMSSNARDVANTKFWAIRVKTDALGTISSCSLVNCSHPPKPHQGILGVFAASRGSTCPFILEFDDERAILCTWRPATGNVDDCVPVGIK